MRFNLDLEEGSAVTVTQVADCLQLELWDHVTQKLNYVMMNGAEAQQLARALRVFGEVLELDH